MGGVLRVRSIRRTCGFAAAKAIATATAADAQRRSFARVRVKADSRLLPEVERRIDDDDAGAAAQPEQRP